MRQMTPLQHTVMDEWRDDPNSACGLRYGEAQGCASGQRGSGVMDATDTTMSAM